MKLLLIPFSWLYSLALRTRYALFSLGILKRIQPNVKTIVLGNLLAGGAGKTPHAIQVARVLKSKGLEIAFLSRGYGRESKGFRKVALNSKVETVGDEALLIKEQFPETKVAVCEDRVKGVEELLNDSDSIDVVILDDAFQHLKLKGGLNILLDRTDKSAFKEWLLPAGLRRDLISATKRANLIIKTRCDLESNTMARVKDFGVPVVSSCYRYKEPEIVCGSGTIGRDIFLLTALAHPQDLKTYLSSEFNLLHHFKFADHHPFSEKELVKIIGIIQEKSSTGLLFTSSKDWVRLKKFKYLFKKAEIAVAIQNIEVDFMNIEHRRAFEKLILDYAGKD